MYVSVCMSGINVFMYVCMRVMYACYVCMYGRYARTYVLYVCMCMVVYMYDTLGMYVVICMCFMLCLSVCDG